MDWMKIARWIDQLNEMETELALLSETREEELVDHFIAAHDEIMEARMELEQVFELRKYGT